MNTKIKFNFYKLGWFLPIGIGFFLRLFGLTRSSIWHDEGYTMWILRFDFWDIILRNARDVHPPGYYLFAKPWVSLFGTSEFSIRFLSLLFSLGIIYFSYKIVLRLFNERAAFWTALIIAIAPFMVRFGQEARMYGVVAFFTTMATYFLVKYILDKRKGPLAFYALAMIAAIYSQYYAFFVVIVHWIIVALATPGFFKLQWKESLKKQLLLWNPFWWVANFVIFVAYLPWFPIAYKQVTRISGDYWIKPEWITVRTIPNNLLQFTAYDHLDAIYYWNNILGPLFYWSVIALLVLAPIFLLIKNKNSEYRNKVLALFVFGYLPMILVFTLSKLRTPVYQDRYFPFSAVAFYALWGTLVASVASKKLRLTLGLTVVAILLVGNVLMYSDVNHRMRDLSAEVNSRIQPNDTLLSGELYTFLDGSYYLGYKDVKFLSKPVDGFGESSVFYLEQDEYVFSPDNIDKLPGRAWVIGKTGEKGYYSDELWAGWKSEIIFEEHKNNGLKAVLYTKK